MIEGKAQNNRENNRTWQPLCKPVTEQGKKRYRITGKNNNRGNNGIWHNNRRKRRRIKGNIKGHGNLYASPGRVYLKCTNQRNDKNMERKGESGKIITQSRAGTKKKIKMYKHEEKEIYIKKRKSGKI